MAAYYAKAAIFTSRSAGTTGETIFRTKRIAMLDDLPDLDADDEEASRREVERKLRSDRATAGADKRRKAGLPLGNRINLHEAQKKGGAAVKRIAQLNSDNFGEWETEAKREGAITGPAFAKWLNNRGRRTPTGETWTSGNVYQTRRKSKLRTAALAAPPPAPPKPDIVNSDQRFTPDGKERLKKAMETRGMVWRKYADLLEEMGFKRLNASIAMADLDGRRISQEMSKALEVWVAKVEAEHGL